MKMKGKVLVIIALAMMAMGTSACGNAKNVEKEMDYGYGANTYAIGKERTKTFSLSDFDALEVEGFVKVHYTQGSKYSVKLVGDSKAIDVYKLKVEENTLHVEMKYNYSTRGNIGELSLYVTMPRLRNVEMSGATKFFAKDISTSKLGIEASGAAIMTIDRVTCEQLGIEMSGAAKVNVSAKAQDTDLDVSGAAIGSVSIDGGSLDADCSGAAKMNLTFKGTTANIEGSGAAKVNAKVDCNTLNAEGSGAGKVTVSGKASYTNVEKSGAAMVDTSKLIRL